MRIRILWLPTKHENESCSTKNVIGYVCLALRNDRYVSSKPEEKQEEEEEE